MNHLLCFGMGYCARALATRLSADSWRITATFRAPEDQLALDSEGISTVQFDGSAPIADDALEGVTHILSSIAPGETGDPVLASCGGQLARRAEQFQWVGYLSTTGVYGDRGGGWVDETSDLTPTTRRGERRLAAENAWLALYRQHALPLHIFRLAGIYGPGPGRNQLDAIRNGTARRIVKPDQVFSRIHVDDIAGVLAASIGRPDSGAVYNVCDDEASPPQDVVTHAAHLLGIEPPPEIDFETAELSPMARSFYAESKRVSNQRMKTNLGYELIYPTYREGLKALLD